MDVFVYGQLMSEALMAAVTGMALPRPIPAVLPDYALCLPQCDVVPSVLSQDGGSVDGFIWADLTDEAVDRLITYTAAFDDILQPVTVSVSGQTRCVQTPLPRAPRDPGPADWSLMAWQADHLAPALLAAADLLSLDPRPDAATSRQFWPAIEARAWSRHRARHAAPATLRHAAQSGDVAMAPIGAPAGSFFRFQEFAVDHQRFDRSRSPRLRRESFIGFDAVIVLPYDPVRDRVLLLEQLRIGPLLRHDPNPWMLEAVAGIIDARETPLQAAMRETQEEAGITPRELVPAGAYYPSPGAVTEHFYTFVGLCDLPDTTPYTGGLDVEGEDLRLHPVDFDAAMALADSGEVTTGPLLTLLYWLARHRDGLRGMG